MIIENLIMSIITLAGLGYLASAMIAAVRKGKRQAKERARSNYGRAAHTGTPSYRQAKRPSAEPLRSSGTSGKQEPYQSSIPQGDGITFRGLRPGTDELAVLIRYNTARERELERSLESRN